MITPQRPTRGTHDDPPSDPTAAFLADPTGYPADPTAAPTDSTPAPRAPCELPPEDLAEPGLPPLPDAAEPAPPHRWGFGAFLLAEAVFLTTSFVILVRLEPSFGDPGVPIRPSTLLISLIVPTVLAALVAVVITRLRGNGPIVDLRLRFGWRDVGIGVTCGIAGVIVTIPLGMLWARWVGEDDANSAVGEIFDGLRMSPVLAVLVFLNVWLLAPMCEEILYRGLLWGAMERRNWNRWVILAITTVVFAAAHGEPKRTPLLLAIGLPMGLARMLSGRLPAAIIAHQINNFLPALGLTLVLLGVPLAEA